jgi:hypothetical protein
MRVGGPLAPHEKPREHQRWEVRHRRLRTKSRARTLLPVPISCYNNGEISGAANRPGGAPLDTAREVRTVNIEHIGIGVTAPISMGAWYRDNLGFRIIQSAGDDVDGVSFITDGEDNSILELFRLTEEMPLDIRTLRPLQLHIAVACKDPGAEAERLIRAGAERLGESPRNSSKGEKILIRDPWGKRF